MRVCVCVRARERERVRERFWKKSSAREDVSAPSIDRSFTACAAADSANYTKADLPIFIFPRAHSLSSLFRLSPPYHV